MVKKLTLIAALIVGCLSLGMAVSSTRVINEAVAQNGQGGSGK